MSDTQDSCTACDLVWHLCSARRRGANRDVLRAPVLQSMLGTVSKSTLLNSEFYFVLLSTYFSAVLIRTGVSLCFWVFLRLYHLRHFYFLTYLQ